MDSKQGVNGAKMKIVQAVISPEELAYLLNIVGADRAYGIDDRLWQTGEVSSLGERLDKGFDALAQNGWLVVEGEEEGSPRYTINPNLILMAATLADPDVVFVTKRYHPDPSGVQTVQIVTHYVTEHLLLEQIKRADGSYRLMTIPTHSLMSERLASALEIPVADLRNGVASVDLDWTKVSALDQIMRYRNGNDLDEHGTARSDSVGNTGAGYAAIREAGIEEAEAAVLERIFDHASPVAKIEMGRTFGAELLSLQTMMVFEVDTEFWCIYSRTGQQALALEKLDKTRFGEIITDSLAKLAEIRPKQL